TATEALARISPADATPILTRALQDRDDNNRAWAAMALWRMGPDAKAAVPALVESVQDRGRIPRGLSLSLLARVDPKNRALDVTALAKALREKGDPFQTLLAAAPLLRIGAAPPQATSELIEALRSEQFPVSLSAAVTLGRIGKSATAPLL